MDPKQEKVPIVDELLSTSDVAVSVRFSIFFHFYCINSGKYNSTSANNHGMSTNIIGH